MAITNMLPQIWSARILAKLEKALIFAQPGVVNRDYEGDIRADGDRVHIHSFNDLTIGSYTKNSTTITYEQLTDTRVTLLIPTFRTLLWVLEYFLLDVSTMDDLPAKERVFDHRECSVSLGWDSTQRNAVIRRYSALVHGAPLKVHSERPEMAKYSNNPLQAATNNCACARL